MRFVRNNIFKLGSLLFVGLDTILVISDTYDLSSELLILFV